MLKQKHAAELNNHCVKIRRAINIGNGSSSGSVQRIKALTEQARALCTVTSLRPEATNLIAQTIEGRN